MTAPLSSLKHSLNYSPHWNRTHGYKAGSLQVQGKNPPKDKKSERISLTDTNEAKKPEDETQSKQKETDAGETQFKCTALKGQVPWIM